MQSAETLRQIKRPLNNVFATLERGICEKCEKKRLSALDSLHGGVRRARTSDLYDVNVAKFVQYVQIYRHYQGLNL